MLCPTLQDADGNKSLRKKERRPNTVVKMPEEMNKSPLAMKTRLVQLILLVSERRGRRRRLAEN